MQPARRGKLVCRLHFTFRLSWKGRALRVRPVVEWVSSFSTVHMVRVNRKVLRLIEPFFVCFCFTMTEEPESKRGKKYAHADTCADCDADVGGLGEAV
jgi:hypothetical protein